MLFYLFLIIILHININIWIYCFVSGLKCKCQSSTTDKIPHSEPLLPDHHLKVCIVHLLHVWVVVGEICHACCHISRSVHPFFFLVFVMLFWFIRQIPLNQKGPRHLSGDLTVPAATAITGSERLLWSIFI